MTPEQMDDLVEQHIKSDNAGDVEHDYRATVPRNGPGVPPDARRITGRMLHLFEFKDGLMSRENVWSGPQSVLE